MKFLGFCLVLLLVGCEQKSPAEVFLEDPAAINRGRLIFAGTCGGYCHSPTRGPREAPFLFDCVWLHGDSDQAIYDTIATGVANSRMIGFGGKMPAGDDDIWKVIAYLKSERDECKR